MWDLDIISALEQKPLSIPNLPYAYALMIILIEYETT